MGQYFHAVNIDKNENIAYINSAGGIKLTESCYVGNSVPRVLLDLLTNRWRGDRVLFVGDYPYGTECSYSAKDYLESLDLTENPFGMGEDITPELLIGWDKPIPERYDSQFWGYLCNKGSYDVEDYRYLVNETDSEYVDLNKCPVAWVWRDDTSGKVEVVRYNPLTLFMAIGNGLGGGDYHYGSAANIDLVGTWAGKTISGSHEVPVGCFEIECPFNESEVWITAPDDAVIETAKRVDSTSLEKIAEELAKEQMTLFGEE